MRRSSLRLLVLAAAFVLSSLAIIIVYQKSSAPPISRRFVETMLARGKNALERRDVDAIMSLFSPDAKILERSPSQVHAVLEQTMKELGAASLTAEFKNLEFHSSGESAIVSLDLAISQHLQNVDASYFRPHINFVLRKVRTPYFLGVLSREEWKIEQFDADTSIDIPVR